MNAHLHRAKYLMCQAGGLLTKINIAAISIDRLLHLHASDWLADTKPCVWIVACQVMVLAITGAFAPGWRRPDLTRPSTWKYFPKKIGGNLIAMMS